MDTSTTRTNVGIEALRVIAMIMIISLHYLGHGGLLYSANAQNNTLGWFLESFSYVAVNVYVLISGYLLVNSTKFKFQRVLGIWMQVFFYSVGIMLLFNYLYGAPMTIEQLMPITNKTYWFATAYMGLYLLHPYLNKMMKSLEQKEFNRLLFIMLVLFVLLSFTLNDTYNIGGGYTLIWLVALYVVGGYIRIFNIKFNRLLASIIYIALSIATFYTKMIFEGNPTLDIFYAYNSPTVIGASIALFLFFKDLKFDIPVVGSVFKFLGPLTFGVYLIHENPNVRDILWVNVIKTQEYYNSSGIMINYITSILTIFLVCVMIEKVRQILFSIPSKLKGGDNNEKSRC